MQPTRTSCCSAISRSAIFQSCHRQIASFPLLCRHPYRFWLRTSRMNPVPFVLMFAAAASIPVPAASAAAPKSIAAFCRANPNLDFPDRTFYGPKHEHGALPEEVVAVGATNWRCMDGKVYVCFGGASGSACQTMNASRTPSRDVRETCEDNPGQDFVAIAVIANSASTWRCRGSVPEIIATVPLDERGFMVETWAPLFDAHGNINQHIELSADPR